MKARSHALIKRMIPTIAVWVVGKVLDTRTVKATLKELDEGFYRKKRRAERNAAKNKGLLTAGAAAIAVGLGLMAVATRE